MILAKGMSAVAASAALVATSPAAALAGEPGAEAAILKYCEPLIDGSSAKQIKDAARKDGFRDEVVAGQSVLRIGEVLVGISDAPRVCFVQAAPAMTLQQGFALVDTWAERHPGAVKAPATKGPDGSPVRAWTDPARKMALLASQQTAVSGQKVMNFILMPLPRGATAGR